MLRVMLLSVLVASTACVTTHGGPSCTRLTDELCDICPKNDAQARLCKCASEGTLTASDFEGQDITDDEAARVCSRILADRKYPGDESAADCRSDLAYLREWDVDACEDLGWIGN